MILFLDDCVYRTQAFIEKYPNALTTSNSTVMLTLLRLYPKVQYLFLDHDLFCEAIENSKIGKTTDGSGMEIVVWLEKNKNLVEIYQIIIHSQNGVASPIMLDRLMKAGYNVVACPFGPMLIEQLGR